MTTLRRQPVLLFFAVTRLVMALYAVDALHYFNRGAVVSDVQLYAQWIDGSFRGGQFPLHDHRWQYPPGAAGPLLLPKLFSNWLIPGNYLDVFVGMCVVADVAVFWLLFQTTRRNAATEGPDARLAQGGLWVWTLGLAAIGPMAYGRYDLVVTALAVAGLTVTLRSRQATSAVRGALIGFGALVKVWPAALLFGAPKRHNGRIMAGSAALAVLVPTAAIALAVPGALSFLTNQKSRGIQIESVFATPFLVGRWFGWSGHIENTEYGAFEYLGPGVSAVATVAVLGTVAGFALLLWIRRRAGVNGGFPLAMMPDAAFAATLVAVVTSRVLSPQYLVWLLGLAAVCLTRRATVQRVPAWTVLGAVSVTQLIFPLFYHSMRGGQVFSGLILVGRNATLVAAAVLALLALWRASGRVRPGQDVGLPAGGEVLLRGAQDRAERRPDRIGGALRGGADGLVEGD